MAVKRYNGTSWIVEAGSQGITYSATAPTTPATGDIWVSTADINTFDSLVQTGNRNILINGDMKVWQRGASFSLAASTTAANGYTADRWDTATGANQACTLSRQATGDTTNLPNIQYCLRYQRNSAQTGTTALTFAQSIETVNSIPLAGKSVTLSFYARAGANYSASGSALSVFVYSGTGTDQNILGTWTGQSTVISQTATLSTTWQKFSYTGTVASTATELSTGFQFTPVGTAGTNDYFEITGVQLEAGSAATPFENRLYTQELALCQRYYYRVSAAAISDRLGLMGTGHGTTLCSVNGMLPVPMRAAPTLSFSNINFWNGSANYTFTSVATQRSTTYAAGADLNISTGNTAGQSIQVTAATAAGYWDAAAEL